MQEFCEKQIVGIHVSTVYIMHAFTPSLPSLRPKACHLRSIPVSVVSSTGIMSKQKLFLKTWQRFTMVKKNQKWAGDPVEFTHKIPTKAKQADKRKDLRRCFPFRYLAFSEPEIEPSRLGLPSTRTTTTLAGTSPRFSQQ